MVKTDLKCTNAHCRHNDLGTCVVRVPYYPGEKIDHCSYFELVTWEDARSIDDQEGRENHNHESSNRNH